MKRYLSLALLSLLASAPIASNAQQIDDKAFATALEKYLATEKGQVTLGKSVEGYFQKRQELARKEQEEKAAAEIEQQFTNPVSIPVGSSPVKGPEKAKVTIVEFSDFQCPFCTRGKAVVEEILKAYPNDVKVAFKNLPLPFHNEAMPAAKAALAAGKQGKFWEMHDKLFDNQAKLNAAYYEAAAKELGLNVDKFKTDMKDPAFEKAIKDDMELASKNGIQGTPGFFVGGVAVKGAYPFEHFKKIIDRHLAAK
jgi:protein-disulfide isomerase